MDSVRTGALHSSLVPSKVGGWGCVCVCVVCVLVGFFPGGEGKRKKAASGFAISCLNQLEAVWDAK